jgi:hypothetical protein
MVKALFDTNILVDHEFGGYLIPALEPPDESGGSRPR